MTDELVLLADSGYNGFRLGGAKAEMEKKRALEASATTRKSSRMRPTAREAKQQELLEQALREPGVADAVSVYEAAEEVYCRALESPVEWVATSTETESPLR